jgi:precorrin-6Y C5,15-methyltransferase (decarboxylating)
MIPVTVIGMGMSPQDLTTQQQQLIYDADVLIGGRRHLADFDSCSSDKIEIHKNIKEILDRLKHRPPSQKMVVLASGDPLYYGIGSLIVKTVGPDQVQIIPNVSAVAAAFAKIKESWQDAEVVSLHGRKLGADLLVVLARSHKIAIYTDPQNNPSQIARFLIENGIKGFQVCVLEQLGSPDERITWYDRPQPEAVTWSDPNMVVLRRKGDENANGRQIDALKPLHLGMPEEAFAHQKGLITKAEIRCITLSKLDLQPHHIFWDLGAGSGSIAIEASLFITQGRIIAVERHPARIKDIQENKRRFQVFHLDVVQAQLPDGLKPLPAPDRIFIGGGGDRLGAIIESAVHKLKPTGRIVINTVLLANLAVARNKLKQVGILPSVIQAQVSRSSPMPWDERLEAQNPVWTIFGIKKES